MAGPRPSKERYAILSFKCTSRAVKEAYVLAEAHKLGPFETEGFHEALSHKRPRIAKYTTRQLDDAIGDSERLERYNAAKWVYTVVSLKNCSVWPTRGAIHWAHGPIDKVVEKIRGQVDPEDRLWEMIKTTPVTMFRLPLIVFRRLSNLRKYRVDDGTYRGVAYYMAGFRHAPAFVGTLKDELNLKWPWNGD